MEAEKFLAYRGRGESKLHWGPLLDMQARVRKLHLYTILRIHVQVTLYRYRGVCFVSPLHVLFYFIVFSSRWTNEISCMTGTHILSSLFVSRLHSFSVHCDRTATTCYQHCYRRSLFPCRTLWPQVNSGSNQYRNHTAPFYSAPAP